MVSQLFLLLTLAAEPNTATILVRRTAVSPADGAVLARQVATRLAGPSFLDYGESQRRLSTFGLSDGTTCGGKSECHAEVGRQLGVAWLVLVSVSQIAQDQSLALELFEVSTEKVYERDSILLPRRGEVPSSMLDSFASRVTAKVEKRAGDAPVATDLTPKPKDEPIAPVEPSPAPTKSHVGSIVLGAAAVAAIGAGVGLLVNGLSMRSRLSVGEVGPDGFVRSELTGSQAKALNDASSIQFGLAGGAAALGLALGATAVVVW